MGIFFNGHNQNEIGMKHFNAKFFIICSILIAGVAYVSFISAYARDEGKIGDGIIRNFMADVMRFPTHVLFKRQTIQPLFFSLGLIINCLLYGLLMERILYLFTKPKKETDVD
jgi:hypothetical protein